MYRVEMYYTVKTLLEKGESQRSISKLPGIHRKTVKRIKESLSQGKIIPEPIKKEKLLTPYTSIIKEWIEKGKTSVIIHEYLKRDKGLKVAYPTVVKFVRSLKKEEVYIPLLADPGEEAQVDFGYLGRFYKDDKLVKVWVFSIVLSHSRYSFHEIVLDQSVSTFITCHIHAFEYFTGVPAIVKIDNLKAGVIAPSFYEPIIQQQYAAFLAHYNCSPVTARIKRGQDKGKVEQGVKYVKNNFLKRIAHKDYYQLKKDIQKWTDETCNQRIHGTTRKIPAQVFNSAEKSCLTALPPERYEIFSVELRKANSFAHVSFRYNFYSVPHTLSGELLTLQYNTTLLKIFNGMELVATHAINPDKGHYITKEEHKPPYKQKKSREHYYEKVTAIGSNAVEFVRELEKIKPRHWHEMTNGILHLTKFYDKKLVDLSCQRAIAYGAISYLEVKNILEKGLYRLPIEKTSLPGIGGYGHELSKYDKIINGKN
jgi:transposase